MSPVGFLDASLCPERNAKKHENARSQIRKKSCENKGKETLSIKDAYLDMHE